MEKAFAFPWQLEKLHLQMNILWCDGKVMNNWMDLMMISQENILLFIWMWNICCDQIFS